MASTTQQYCLRWNNHRNNLLAVFDELLQNEAFTDCTLFCEGGSIKCHRMVLAACSPYFQNLFTDLPCKHPVVVLKDVKYTEIKAILEYMYRGEVNVAQDDLAALLKIAEALKVKGLVDENRSCRSPPPCEEPPIDRSPSISTSTATPQNPVHSSSGDQHSPPHSSSGLYKNPYSSLYDRKTPDHNSRLMGMWPLPGLPLPPHTASMPNQAPHPAVTAAAAMLSSAYDVNSDMSPLKRKKLSSLLMARDTPILRTVLGQGQPDSSQPVSLVCHPDSMDHLSGGEDRVSKHMKNEPSEDAQSPYTDFTDRMTDDEEKSKLAIPSSSPQSFSSHDMRASVTSGIASYVNAQKPEWKRYKQYTRHDILSAIEAVKNGMSALQAARKYGVPSRTLYDKVKKMGITTSRPFKRGTNGTSACFPYGTGSPYGHLSESEENINNNTAMLEPSAFLQHVLDYKDSGGGDGREALAAMAAAAVAHSVASGQSTSPNSHHRARSPSPSPTMLKYMRHSSLTPSPAPHSDQTNGSSERERDEDEVEDLSVHRKHDLIESRVIMPPISAMTQVAAMMKQKEELLIDTIKEEARQSHLLKTEAD